MILVQLKQKRYTFQSENFKLRFQSINLQYCDLSITEKVMLSYGKKTISFHRKLRKESNSNELYIL